MLCNMTLNTFGGDRTTVREGQRETEIERTKEIEKRESERTREKKGAE